MKRKCRITKPKTKPQYQGGGSYGFFENQKYTNTAKPTHDDQYGSMYGSYNMLENDVNTKYPEVDKNNANIEAEKGELIWKADGKLYRIEGKKHSKGGTPIIAEDGDFIFSDHVKIKDVVLSFVKPQLKEKSKEYKQGKTPAELIKNFDLDEMNNFIDKLESDDPFTRQTAELAIQGINKKLAEIAYAQEKTKGEEERLPQRITQYLPEINTEQQEVVDTPQLQAKYGGSYKKLKTLKKAQNGLNVQSNNSSVIIPRDRNTVSEIKKLKEGQIYQIEGDNTQYIIQNLKGIKLQNADPNYTLTLTQSSDLKNQLKRIPEGMPYSIVNSNGQIKREVLSDGKVDEYDKDGNKIEGESSVNKKQSQYPSNQSTRQTITPEINTNSFLEFANSDPFSKYRDNNSDVQVPYRRGYKTTATNSNPQSSTSNNKPVTQSAKTRTNYSATQSAQTKTTNTPAPQNQQSVNYITDADIRNPNNYYGYGDFNINDIIAGGVRGDTINQSQNKYGTYGQLSESDPQSFIDRHQWYFKSKGITSPDQLTTDVVKDFQSTYNKFHNEQTGRDYFTGDDKYGVDGKLGEYTFKTPLFQGTSEFDYSDDSQLNGKGSSYQEYETDSPYYTNYKGTKIQSSTTPSIEEDKGSDVPTPKSGDADVSTFNFKDYGYSNAEKLALANGLRNIIGGRNTPPVKQNVDFQTPEIEKVDPRFAINQIQNQSYRLGEQLSRTANPAAAGAIGSDIFGSALEAFGNVSGQYDNMNAGLVNQNDSQATQIRNQENQINSQYADQYNTKVSQYNENLWANKQAARNQFVDAYGQIDPRKAYRNVLLNTMNSETFPIQDLAGTLGFNPTDIMSFMNNMETPSGGYSVPTKEEFSKNPDYHKAMMSYMSKNKIG